MPRKKRESKKKKSDAEEQDEFFDQIEDEDVEEEKSDLEQLEEQPEWIDQEDEEGQLSVDVYEESDAIIVKSTIAGVEPEDVDITIVNDMLTIRGERKTESKHKSRDYFFQECYWGAFSRSIILPVEVDVKKIDATIKNGILTVTLPKLTVKPKKSIRVKDHN
jgi:HSP20 family protein